MLTLEKCPVCRARLRPDAPLDEPCRRCGSDLTLVRACLARAACSQAEARTALARGDAEAALAAARRAVRYADRETTRRTLAAALVALGRAEAARALLASPPAQPAGAPATGALECPGAGAPGPVTGRGPDVPR